MRVLIIGSGGREHALAWKLKQEEPSVELLAAPGNPGISALAECVPISATDLPALLALARERAVDLTVVGPEGPLALGIVDQFREAGLSIFGPTRGAAEIETSKGFAKQLMLDDNIPTALAEMHVRVEPARKCARMFGAPVVVKASGLAAGKGVIVCQTIAEADAAIADMLEGNRFGPAGTEVLIEEYMEGEELSVFAITDGTSFVRLPALQDHKRLLDGDRGPNTGGMGAYVPITLPLRPDRPVSDGDTAIDVVIHRTLKGLAARGRPFTGLLYAGFMMTRDGPRVVEFNCRFGDPETQALMPVLSGSHRVIDLLLAVGRGEPLPRAEMTVSGACVTTVLAALNYPETPRTGDPITLPADVPDVVIFHAGTARDSHGGLITAGGRVLAVTATGASIADAQRRSLDVADEVQFAGKQFRTDIGWREMARRQEPPRARAPGN